MADLRHFLSRAPVPRAVRAVLAEGEPVTIAIGPSRKRWSDAEGAIPPETIRLEALDANGAVMRSLAIGEPDDAPPARPGATTANAAPSTPLELARIVLDATDAGARRHAAAYEATMRELVGLVRIIADQHAAAQRRLAALESAYHRMVRAAPDAAAEDGAGLDALMGPLLAAAFSPPAEPANGKGAKV